MSDLDAPFPYFGGKRIVAAECWRRFGRVRNYVEPFFGSGAVLFGCPYIPDIETVNDTNAYLANFWRAVKIDPDAVAAHADWPVNEVDLEARHKWLVQRDRKQEHAARMKDDPDYYDAKIVGWWVWGACAWIGRGWCAGKYVGRGSDENSGCGINVADPERGGQLPHLGNAGRGVHRQLPHLSGAGQGVHRQLPHLSGAGQGECERRAAALRDWIGRLSDRLRNTRVTCGDFERVLGPSVTFKNGPTAVFLDPPYSAEAGRDNDIYAEEDPEVAHRAADWCAANGANPLLRIALCGYEGEGHERLESMGWSVFAWKANGGMGVQNRDPDAPGRANRARERIWFSPHCGGRGLFDR